MLNLSHYNCCFVSLSLFFYLFCFIFSKTTFLRVHSGYNILVEFFNNMNSSMHSLMFPLWLKMAPKSHNKVVMLLDSFFDSLFLSIDLTCYFGASVTFLSIVALQVNLLSDRQSIGCSCIFIQPYTLDLLCKIPQTSNLKFFSKKELFINQFGKIFMYLSFYISLRKILLLAYVSDLLFNFF